MLLIGLVGDTTTMRSLEFSQVAPWPPEAAPFVHVRVEDGVVRADGMLSAFFGHRVDLGRGRDPGGNWAEWGWDGTELTVRNDRFRGYPLYYAASESSIAVSPSIDTLLSLGSARALDTDAIAVFLTVGFYVGSDTPFKAIRALPAAAELRWRDGRLHIGRRVQPSPSRENDLSRPAAVRQAAELVRNAVRRVLPDEEEAYLFSLSGGHDSRHLLLELLDAGRPPRRCVTSHHHPHVWGGDVPYAADVARSLGLQHEIVTPGRFVAAEWHKNRMTSYCADEHAWYTAVTQAFEGRTRRSYDGLNGVQLRAPLFRSKKLERLHDERRWDAFAANLGRRHKGAPRYAPLIAPDMDVHFGPDRAALRIREDLELYVGHPHPFNAWRLANRTVRELNLPSTAMLTGVPAVHTPFMDAELVDLIASLPPGIVDDPFHDDVMADRFPDAHALPYRPRPRPTPSRRFKREVARDLLNVLRTHSDGTLVARAALSRRSLVGAVTGSDWWTWGRRATLAVYLVQLESIVRGDGPGPMEV